MPVIGPKSAAELRLFIEHPEPPIADENWIAKEIGLLAIKPSRKASQADVKVILEIYIAVLKEYSRVDLGYAFGRLTRENKWFPDVSEIIDLVKLAQGKRSIMRNRAKSLIMKHEREWQKPIPLDEIVSLQEVQIFLSKISIASNESALA